MSRVNRLPKFIMKNLILALVNKLLIVYKKSTDGLLKKQLRKVIQFLMTMYLNHFHTQRPKY